MAAQPIDREGPRQRPSGSPVGYQSWSDLAFLHWRVPPEQLRPLIPLPLELDLYDGAAWVGLVPFCMNRVRPSWSPSVPGISWFRETNVRTYVHFEGQPGVYFFSLDASKLLAVCLARWRWRLPYYWARMRCQAVPDRENPTHFKYTSCRQPGVYPAASCRLELQLGEAFPELEDGTCAPANSLEFFLVERYLLYAFQGSDLWRGQVYHRPYLVRHAEVLSLEEDLLAAAGITVEQPPCHVAFSPGVDVDIFPLERVAKTAALPKPQTAFAS